MMQYTGVLLRSLLVVSAGGTAILGGSYLLSKYKSRKEAEERLARLEQLVGQLTELEKPAAQPQATRKAAPKKPAQSKARSAASKSGTKSAASKPGTKSSPAKSSTAETETK